MIHQTLGAKPANRTGVKTTMSNNPTRTDGAEAPSVKTERFMQQRESSRWSLQETTSHLRRSTPSVSS